LLNDSINLGLKVTLIGSVFHVVNTLIFGLENIATVWLGLHEVMNGGFSTGMLFAYISWKGQFTEKTSALIEKFIEFRMLSLHSERVADIALQKTEVLSASGEEKIKILRGMKVENLSYRYSDLEPWIFKDLSFDIYPNECLVLAGNSGCGKSTLLKVLIGLLPAQTGKIEVDQKPLHSLGSAWRESIGVVMQEDSLFAGSIIDNISFNDPKPDMQRIEGAATLAFIKEDILRMPMNWNTLVGDMGSALSGGQKQRLLLARALYRMPRILFLDEASSHLDVTAEKAINDNLKRLGITRIVVAHRPETIASADRVLWLAPLAG
jgi:ATP-binding cassette subfamily B protein RaxB